MLSRQSPSKVQGEPKVVFWYRVYCAAMALLYVGCTALAVALLVWRA